MLPFWRAVLASQQPSVTGWSPVAGVGEALPRGRDLTLRDDNLPPSPLEPLGHQAVHNEKHRRQLIASVRVYPPLYSAAFSGTSFAWSLALGVKEFN